MIRRFPLRTKRGIALLFVLGMLTLLLTLAVAFVSVVQLDRKSSMRAMGSAKADILAEAAVRRAVQNIEYNYLEGIGEGKGQFVKPTFGNLFYDSAGVLQDVFMVSVPPSGTPELVNEEEWLQLRGGYATSSTAINNGPGESSIESVMRNDMSTAGQKPAWIDLGETGAKLAYFARDLSGYANHALDRNGNYAIAREGPADSGFNVDPSDIEIPIGVDPTSGLPYSHAPAKTPLGAYYAGGWPSLGITDPHPLWDQVDKMNTKILKPINLTEMMSYLKSLNNAPPASSNPGIVDYQEEFEAAVSIMGTEYPALTASALTNRVGEIAQASQRDQKRIAWHALRDYVDADLVPVYGSTGPQTEPHPAISEAGMVVHVKDVRLKSSDPVGTTGDFEHTYEWTLEAHMGFESAFLYYDPSNNASARSYDVNGILESTVTIDGTSLTGITAHRSTISESATYSPMEYITHMDMVTATHEQKVTNSDPNGGPAPSIMVSYSTEISDLRINLGANEIDRVVFKGPMTLTAPNTSVRADAVNPNYRTGAGGSGILVPASTAGTLISPNGKDGGVSWEAPDPRFNWEFKPGGTLLIPASPQWKKNDGGGGLLGGGGAPSMGFKLNGGAVSLQGRINVSSEKLAEMNENDRDLGTYIANDAMTCVGELGNIVYDMGKTISITRRQTPGAGEGRFHPVWNYFSVHDHERSHRNFINPNSNHYVHRTGRRSLAFAIEGAVIGRNWNRTDPVWKSTLSPDDANKIAEGIVALSQSKNFVNVSDIAYNATLAEFVESALSIKNVPEVEIESYHANIFEIFNTRNNVYAINFLVKVDGVTKQFVAEAWRDAFPPANPAFPYHDTFAFKITSP